MFIFLYGVGRGGGVGQLWTEQHVYLPVRGGEGGGGRPAMD